MSIAKVISYWVDTHMFLLKWKQLSLIIFSAKRFRQRRYLEEIWRFPILVKQLKCVQHHKNVIHTLPTSSIWKDNRYDLLGRGGKEREMSEQIWLGQQNSPHEIFSWKQYIKSLALHLLDNCSKQRATVLIKERPFGVQHKWYVDVFKGVLIKTKIVLS